MIEGLKLNDRKGSDLTRRQLRVAELIRREVEDIIIRKLVVDCALSVSRVDVGVDMKLAKVYVSFRDIIGYTRREDLEAQLRRVQPLVSSVLHKVLRMKKIPSIRFILDES